jgi:hypothetical protein
MPKIWNPYPSRTHERFGRLPSIDSRDRRYLMKRHIEEAPTPVYNIRHWGTGKVMDQGQTPHCVEYSGRQWLYSNPVRNVALDEFGVLYRECQKVDEWPGEDYEGTSVRALFKVLQAKGYVETYGWAFDVQTTVDWVLMKGPVVFGTDWFSGMMDTDEYGFIHASGYAAGGHAYLCKGVNRIKQCPDGSVGAFRIINSWGKGWGQYGHAWLSFKDMAMLIDRDGEVATALEMRKAA